MMDENDPEFWLAVGRATDAFFREQRQRDKWIDLRCDMITWKMKGFRIP